MNSSSWKQEDCLLVLELQDKIKMNSSSLKQEDCLLVLELQDKISTKSSSLKQEDHVRVSWEKRLRWTPQV